jgi:hypothetical protein
MPLISVKLRNLRKVKQWRNSRTPKLAAAQNLKLLIRTFFFINIGGVMKTRSILNLVLMALAAQAAFGQSDLQITKRSSRTIPGVSQMPTGVLTPQMAQQFKEMTNNTATVYIKGPRMRNDIAMKVPTMTGKLEPHTFSTLFQCDLQRTLTFSTRSKKYWVSGSSSGKSAGGAITISGKVTDTGEKAKLFGFETRRLKQSITFTPSANACMKQTFRIEVDGWYADVPGFTCPTLMAPPEATEGGDCQDSLMYKIDGAVTGIALKETRTLTIEGQVMILEDEAIDIVRTTLPDSLFEPPSGYKAAFQRGNLIDNSACIAELSLMETFGSLPAFFSDGKEDGVTRELAEK